MDDQWFADKFETIAGHLGSINSRIGNIEKVQVDQEKRVRDLEDRVQVIETTKKVKDKFYEKYPIRTAIGGATIGGISLASVFSFLFWVLTKIL